MKTIASACFAVLVLAFAADACNVCHSKNPNMVTMHKRFTMSDCFACHSKGMQKDKTLSMKQRETDQRCTRCHQKK